MPCAPKTAVLTAEQARSLFAYDPESGVVTRKRRTSSRAPAGAEVGSPSKGYLNVCVAGRIYQLHRVIWLIVTGAWPCQEIDHADGDKKNNRWANLRDVTRTVNNQNRRRPYKNNTLGLQGVSPYRGRFSAEIQVDGQRIRLGHFGSKEAAHSAYVAAKRLLHPS